MGMNYKHVLGSRDSCTEIQILKTVQSHLELHFDDDYMYLVENLFCSTRIKPTVQRHVRIYENAYMSVNDCHFGKKLIIYAVRNS